jgi:arylsulfatase A-like enzyme
MKKNKRPNVIWIFGDQHRAQATGFAGDPNLHTPNLDRFAAEGAVCTRALSGFPLCCPARGSLLSGLYPHRCVPGHEIAFPADQRTVAHELKDAGYHTAYFGKWHLGGFEEKNGRAAFFITDPDRRGGFDEWLGYDNNNSQFDSWVHGGRGEDAVHYRLPGYETDALTDLLIDYLERRAGAGDKDGESAPFFAALSVQPPHDPYIAPEEWMGNHTPGTVELRPNVPAIPHVVERARRQLAGYYAMIENLDWNFGRVREALDRLGLTGDTHILFFSDHGDMQGSHGQFGKNAPWEESIRIPLVIGGGPPFYELKGGANDFPLNMADIAATTLGLCGVDLPAGMQGKDFSGLRIHGKDLPADRDSGYLQGVIPTCHSYSIDRPWRGIVTRDGWKYACLEGQPWLLFNLNEDPYEQANLAHNSKYWPERKRLQAELTSWIDATGDSFELPSSAG